MPAPFMAIIEPRLMMRVPLDTMWSRAFVALAGCLEGYLAGRGFVPDLLRCAHLCTVGAENPIQLPCVFLGGGGEFNAASMAFVRPGRGGGVKSGGRIIIPVARGKDGWVMGAVCFLLLVLDMVL